MTYPTISKALNLDKQIFSLQDLMQIARQGLTRNAIDSVAAALAISPTSLAKHLQISERTLQRYDSEKKLSPELSDRLIQIAKVYDRAVDVFEDEENAVAWLKHPSKAIGNALPIDYLDNSSGREIILDELIRIEYGVVA